MSSTTIKALGSTDTERSCRRRTRAAGAFIFLNVACAGCPIPVCSASANNRSALEDTPERSTGTVQFVALERQHASIRRELETALTRTLASSGFTLGEEVESFEADFAAYCGVAHCVGVASGTAALSLTLRAFGVGPGDEVIVPAHTFISSALAVAHTGATPVLCDVLPSSGLIDPEAARAAVNSRTAAIIAVHLYGQVCEMSSLRGLAEQRGLLLIEDAAQAHGARYCDQRAGSLGAAAAFSFYPTKNLGALGDGGAICTNDAMVAARLRTLRNVGQRKKGEHVELGYNERLDGLQAAFLRAKLGHLDEWNAARRRHAAAYRELLPPGVLLPEETPRSPSVFHLFPARFADRDAVAAALMARGVQTGVHYAVPVHGHPAWRGKRLLHGALPNAEAWAARELSLPMHPHLRADEVNRVVDAVAAALTSPAPRRGDRRRYTRPLRTARTAA
jgi:dTDP-4-amino-4,6-dideoxygalactose transaminase